MSSSPEGSPDWLRSFKAPDPQEITLSSDSDSSIDKNIERDYNSESKVIHTSKTIERDPKEAQIVIGNKKSLGDESQKSKSPKIREPVKEIKLKEEDMDNSAITGDGSSRKHNETHVSRMPLVFAEKVQRTKFVFHLFSKILIECGDSIDMSGDVGAVGRVVTSDTQNVKSEMLLDLKGTIYKTTIIPSRTFCVVSFGPTEAKVEAIMSDFVQLKPHSNVYEAETMIEGTLEGFSFDSDEEGERIPKFSSRQNEQSNEHGTPDDSKAKGKAERSTGHKRAKPSGKTPKKGGKKSQPPKKAKGTKK